MSDELDDYFRCEKTARGWSFEVATVHWPHPYAPELKWTSFRRWKTAPDSARLQKARTAAILGNARYFRTCTRCNQLNCQYR